MAPRKVEGWACSGHVTGQRSLRGRGSLKGLQRAPTNTMLFSDYHLAKLNPKCHKKVKSCYNPLRLGTVIVLVSSGIDFVNTPRLYSDRATR